MLHTLQLLAAAMLDAGSLGAGILEDLSAP
jgi:hypothetical protein